MGPLDRFGNSRAEQQRLAEERRAELAETETRYRLAWIALESSHSAIKRCLEQGTATTRLPNIGPDGQVNRIEVTGPWVLYLIPDSGPSRLRLVTKYESTKSDSRYGASLYESVVLQAEVREGTSEDIGKIWRSTGGFVDRGVSVYPNLKNRINPLGEDAMEIYEAIDVLAAES